MPPKDAAAAAADAAPALAPAVPPGHFAVNVPLPQIFLPELIIRRDSEAVAGSMDAFVLSTSKRDDGSFMVKMSVAKRFAISFYKKEQGDDKVPEAKAVGALIVRHIAGLIIARLKSSLEIARAAVESESPDGEALTPLLYICCSTVVNVCVQSASVGIVILAHFVLLILTSFLFIQRDR